MSLAEVQARTAELQLRLRMLQTGGTTAAGTLGVAGAPLTDGAAPSFADALSTATAATTTSTSSAASTAAWSATGTGGTPTGADVVAKAKEQLGTKYVWGGESLAEGGFDCSGLVQWTYGQLGIDLPRVSGDQARAGRAVTPAEAQPGDLVFFERGKVDHIGIYAGNGQWVVAPKTGDVVKLQAVDLSRATTIRRVLPDTATPSAPGAASSVLAAGLPAAGRKYASQIQTAARAAGIDPALLAAVAWSESGFDPSARSGAGAVGLVQLMPRTAAGLGVTDPTDPAQSLAGGAKYLKQQLDAFGGRTDLALAAYNAGPTAVRRSGGVPPYQETQEYVKKVLDRARSLGSTA